jgi:hypothetical protein
MQESKDLMEVFTYFDDHFGHSADFNRLGSPVPNEPLVSVACSIVKVALSISVTPTKPLTFIPEHHLWHGVMVGEGGIVVVIYFADIDRGVCNVMRFAGGISFLRFSMPEGLNQGFDPDSAVLEWMAPRPPDGESN